MNPAEKFLGPEDKLQIQVCRYIALQYPDAIMHHSPNEGKRSHVLQYKIVHMGVSSGFPDLFVLYRGHVMAIELKAGKNKPTPAQLQWLQHLNTHGIPSKVCTGFDEAQAWLDEQLAPLKSPKPFKQPQ